jgi:hypothetical protein
MTPNGEKSLAQLTGVDWGKPPENVSSLVRERHEFRQTPLDLLSIPGLQRLLAIDFQNDSEILVPYCVRRLFITPVADIQSLSQHLSLLLFVMRSERFEWLQCPDSVRKVRKIVESWSRALSEDSDDAEQTDDSLDYYRVLLPNTQMQVSLFEVLAQFEQRLSRVTMRAAPAP